MVGELDAGNPHVQFDEGAQETCDSATRLCPTLRSSRLVGSGLDILFQVTSRALRGGPGPLRDKRTRSHKRLP